MTALLEYYRMAYNRVVAAGYQSEIYWCKDMTTFDDCTPERFFNEYVWCVLNAGMKEQIARKIYDRFMEVGNTETIGHLGKRAAIKRGIVEYPQWFRMLQGAPDKIEYLETLPWIGPITKYHLARNIGIDCVKPDRHLVRLAEQMGFKTPLEMCLEIQKSFPHERLGTIDVILWRDCNLRAGVTMTSAPAPSPCEENGCTDIDNCDEICDHSRVYSPVQMREAAAQARNKALDDVERKLVHCHERAECLIRIESLRPSPRGLPPTVLWISPQRSELSLRHLNICITGS